MNNPQHHASRAVLAITLAWCAALMPGGAAAVENGAHSHGAGLVRWRTGAAAAARRHRHGRHHALRIEAVEGQRRQLTSSPGGRRLERCPFRQCPCHGRHPAHRLDLRAQALRRVPGRRRAAPLLRPQAVVLPGGPVPARLAGACNGGHPVAARHAGDGPWGEHQRAGRSRDRADHLLGGGPHERGPRRIHDLSHRQVRRGFAHQRRIRQLPHVPADDFPLGMRATAGTPAREWRWPSILATATPM